MKKFLFAKKKFKAAILSKLNHPLEIKYIELPDELKFGQVLVKILYTSICGSQVGEIQGVKGKDHFLPHLLGHEGVGRVVETGEGITKVKKNDLVILHWKIGKGLQSQNPEYFDGSKKINSGSVTTFSEYSIVSENRITNINTTLPKKILPLLGCCIPTSFGAVEYNANLKFNQKVLIFGVGGIGHNILIAASSIGCEITIVDINLKKLKILKSKFKCHTVHIKNSSQNIIKDLKSMGNFDVCFETTGIIKNIEIGYQIIDPILGKLILIGVPKKNHLSKLYTLDMHFGKKIIGSHGGDFNPDYDLNRYLKFIENNYKYFISQIDEVIELSNINDGIQKIMKNKSIGKIIVKI